MLKRLVLVCRDDCQYEKQWGYYIIVFIRVSPLLVRCGSGMNWVEAGGHVTYEANKGREQGRREGGKQGPWPPPFNLIIISYTIIHTY